VDLVGKCLRLILSGLKEGPIGCSNLSEKKQMVQKTVKMVADSLQRWAKSCFSSYEKVFLPSFGL